LFSERLSKVYADVSNLKTIGAMVVCTMDWRKDRFEIRRPFNKGQSYISGNRKQKERERK
jgi:hypothetical protein